MNESELASEIENLLMTPFYLTGSTFVLEFLGIILVFASVIIIFTRTMRPGRIAMLVSLVLTTLTILPVLFINDGGNIETSEFDRFVIWYLPLLSSLFACIGFYGFFKFALSHSDES